MLERKFFKKKLQQLHLAQAITVKERWGIGDAQRTSCTNLSVVNLISLLVRDGAGKRRDLGHTDFSTKEIYNRSELLGFFYVA